MFSLRENPLPAVPGRGLPSQSLRSRRGTTAMARPKLPDDARRTRTIGVRVSSIELCQLTKKAAAAGLDPSGLLRAAGVAGVVPPPPVPAVNIAEYARLGHLSNNVNQLAHQANAGHAVVDAGLLDQVAAEVRRLRLALVAAAPEGES